MTDHPTVTVLESESNPEEVICTAARNDYSESFVGNQDFEDVMDTVEGDTIEEKKETLIAHLLDHGHFGPFEHPHITFAVEGVSRSCMAQLTRHRHVSFDVQSMRYVSFEDVDPAPGEGVVAIPELEDAELHGRNAEFGIEESDWQDKTIQSERERIYSMSIKLSVKHYNELLNLGVAPENARMVLPIGTKVNIVFTLNARMLMHVADMRAAADAQFEIRELTENLLQVAKDWCPITFEYYEKNMKNRKNRLAP